MQCAVLGAAQALFNCPRGLGPRPNIADAGTNGYSRPSRTWTTKLLSESFLTPRTIITFPSYQIKNSDSICISSIHEKPMMDRIFSIVSNAAGDLRQCPVKSKGPPGSTLKGALHIFHICNGLGRLGPVCSGTLTRLSSASCGLAFVALQFHCLATDRVSWMCWKFVSLVSLVLQ